MLLDLIPKTFGQASLLEIHEDNTTGNNVPLMSVIDDINRRYGQDTVRLGITNLSDRWKMKQSMLSPAYTTRWTDLPTAIC